MQPVNNHKQMKTMTQNNTDIRPMSEEEHGRIIERLRSYDGLPEEECVEKLRCEIRGFESSILAITGDPIETCWWDTVKPDNVADYVEELLGFRYYALTRLFEIHCTEAEVRRIERVNDKLLEMTREMFERTGQVYRYFLDMPRDRSEEELEVEGTLRYWEDAEPLRLEDDDFYGSDFRRIIPIIAYLGDHHHGELPIITCSPSYDPDRKFNSSMSDRELGIENTLDDGVSWAEAGLHDERLSHIVFCYASHAVVTHKNFCIPDYMRMDTYEIKVDIQYQHFRKTE